MPDHFATLGQPRRPWIESEALKEAFHRATAQHHPDIAGGSGDQAAALNAAYAILRDPAARLRHLLKLEWPDAGPAPATIAPELADLFGGIAAVRQAGAGLKKKAAAAQSPLARALLAGERAAYRRELEAALAALASAETSALENLRALDTAWSARTEESRLALVAAQQSFAYLAKWQSQLREDLFQLGE